MIQQAPDDLMLKVLGTLTESQARWYVARETLARGRGGLKAMYELTGASAFASQAGDGSGWKSPTQNCRPRWSGLWKRTLPAIP